MVIFGNKICFKIATSPVSLQCIDFEKKTIIIHLSGFKKMIGVGNRNKKSLIQASATNAPLLQRVRQNEKFTLCVLPGTTIIAQILYYVSSTKEGF